MSLLIMTETIPNLSRLLSVDGKTPPQTCIQILDSAYAFSRMLHGSRSTSGGTTDAFYRAFVPELGSVLHPRQIELIKRCVKSERGEPDRVGACVFPGLVKISRGTVGEGGKSNEDSQTVVRRAQVVCQCALGYHNEVQQQQYQQQQMQQQQMEDDRAYGF